MIDTLRKGGEAMGAAVKEMVFTPETLSQFKADVEMFVKEIMAKVDETSKQQWRASHPGLEEDATMSQPDTYEQMDTHYQSIIKAT